MYSFERETNAGIKLVGVRSILYALSMGKIVLECTVIRWKKIEDMVFFKIQDITRYYLCVALVIQQDCYPDSVVVLFIFPRGMRV